MLNWTPVTNRHETLPYLDTEEQDAHYAEVDAFWEIVYPDTKGVPIFQTPAAVLLGGVDPESTPLDRIDTGLFWQLVDRLRDADDNGVFTIDASAALVEAAINPGYDWNPEA